MTRSDTVRERASQILDRLTALLDGQRLAEQIDEPIDRALAQFDGMQTTEYSAAGLHDAVAEFLRHAYRERSPGGRTLSASRARDEAVALLEEAYEGTLSNGYYAAVVDAADTTQPGLPLVLARLAESLKVLWRNRHIRAVAARHIDPADWATKCAKAAILIDRCRLDGLHPLAGCPPEQLADEVLDLLVIDLAARDQLPPDTLP